MGGNESDTQRCGYRDGENYLAVFRFLVRVLHENLYIKCPFFAWVVLEFAFLFDDTRAVFSNRDMHYSTRTLSKPEIGKATYNVLFTQCCKFVGWTSRITYP